MPAFFVLDERDTRALKGFRQDDKRLIAEANRGKDFDDFVEVVAVNFLGPPAEGLEPIFINIQIMAKGSGLTLAEPVDIHNGDEVIQMIDPGERGCFPNASFCDLAVTEQDVGSIIE